MIIGRREQQQETNQQHAHPTPPKARETRIIQQTRGNRRPQPITIHIFIATTDPPSFSIVEKQIQEK